MNAVPAHPPVRGGRTGRHDAGKAITLVLLATITALTAAYAVSVGSAAITIGDVVAAVFAPDGSREHLVITTVRLPRVLAALLAGSALSVSGAIMQAITGNPLASPGLLGINAGAAFAVVVAMSLFGIASSAAHVWFAFAGAAFAGAIVFIFGSTGSGGATPLRLVLAGAVLTAFLTSLTTALLIFDQTTLEIVRLWTAGSLSGRSMANVVGVAPYIATGLAIAMLFRGQVTTLSLGGDIARSLGQDAMLWRGVAVLAVILLAGGAVALAGPVGFVGLVVPHIVRMTIGVDYRWIIPFGAVAGALLVVVADLAGRTLFASQSFPVGVTMALIGAPFFVWLARLRVRKA